MPRRITFEGQTYSFPDDASDDEVMEALGGASAPAGGATAPASAQPGLGEQAGAAASGAVASLERFIADKTGIGRKRGNPLQSESDLDAMVRGQPAAPVTRPKPEGGERREGLGAGLFGVADQGVRGVAQGAAVLAGLPVDATTMMLNMTPGVAQLRTAMGLSPNISRPFLGSEFNKGALDTANDATIGAVNAATGANLDLPVREGDNPVERIANRIGQEMGATALPVAGAIGKAASVGMEGARAIQNPIARYYTEQAAAGAGKFATKELGMASAAGTGAGIVNEGSRAAGADEHSAGYVAGDLAGALGGAGAFSVAKSVGGMGLNVLNAVRAQSKYTDQVVRDAVVDRLAKATDAPTVPVGNVDAYDVGPLARQIDEARTSSIADTVPGYRDTLADTLKSPGLAQLEYGRRAAGSDKFAEIAGPNEAAVNAAIDARAPTGATDDLRTALSGRRTELRDEVAQAVTAARARENTAADAVRPRMTPDVRGAEIRGPLRQAQQEANAARGAMWPALREGEVPVEPLADAFAQRRAGLSEAERVTMDPEHLTSIPGRRMPAPTSEAAPAPVPGLEGMTAEEQAMAQRLLEQRPAPAAAAAAPASPSLNLSDLPFPTSPGTEDRIMAAIPGLPTEASRARAGSSGGVTTWALRQALPDMSEQDLTHGLFNLQSKGHGNLSQLSDPRSVPQGAFVANVAGRHEDRHLFYPSTDSVEQFRQGARAPEPAAPTPRLEPAATPPTPESDAPPVMPLREVTGLRSALSSEHRAALTANDTNRARVVQGYIDALDGYVAEHHPNPEGYAAAREATRDYHDRFSRPTTDVAQVLRENQGVPVVPDANVAPRFARPNTGSQEGLGSLLRETGADFRPREAVADQLRAQADGLRTPEAVRTFMAEHSQALENFPQLRTQLEERAGAQGYRQGQEARSAATDSLYGTENSRGSTAVGRYLHYSPEQSRQAVRGVLNDAKPAEATRELFDFANRSPEAIAGMRRGLWDEIEARGRRQGETTRGVSSGDQPWKPEAVAKFINQPNVRAVLNEAYRDNPEHLADIDKLFEVLQGANTGVRGRVANTSGTAQGLTDVIKGAISPERIQSDVRSIKRGQMSLPYVGVSLAATIARKSVQKAQAGAIDRMLDEALTNPQAAAALLRENNPVNRAYLQRNASLWFGEHADKIAAAANDDAPPDSVKDAIRRSNR